MDHGRVLVIDDDGSFIVALRQVFRKPDFSQFQLHHLVPTDLDIVGEAVGFVARELERAENDVVAILLDIVFDSHSSASDRSGTAIAAQVRELNLEIPLIAVTDHSRQDALLVDVSFDIHFDGIVPKDIILDPAFDHAFFERILTIARRKLQDRPLIRRAPPRGLERSQRQPRSLELADYEYGFADDVGTVYQVEEVGKTTVNQILQGAFGTSIGTVRSFSPGFSGAFLFALDIVGKEEGRSEGNETYWILKMSRDTAALERELESHRNLRTRGVPKEAYPALLKDHLIEVGGWAGIVMERAAQSKTLRDYLLGGARTEDIPLVMSNLAAFLGRLYGRSRRKSAPVWAHFYSFTSRQRAAMLRGIEFGEQAIRRYGGEDIEEALKAIKLFVRSDGGSCERLRELTRNVDTRLIHGDLHSRNILVDDEKRVTAIDFAKVDQGHVVRDVAKLEVDLLIGILDSGDGKDTSWRSMPRWKRLGARLLMAQQLVPKECAEVMTKREYTIFESTRSVVHSISEDFQWPEYRMALLYHLLRALAYPDISLPKKALAISCSSKIIAEVS